MSMRGALFGQFKRRLPIWAVEELAPISSENVAAYGRNKDPGEIDRILARCRARPRNLTVGHPGATYEIVGMLRQLRPPSPEHEMPGKTEAEASTAPNAGFVGAIPWWRAEVATSWNRM